MSAGNGAPSTTPSTSIVKPSDEYPYVLLQDPIPDPYFAAG